MSNLIVYFSGTGNTLKVVKEVAKCLGECSVLSVRKALHGGLPSQVSTLGIAFPVYFGALPPIIVDLIKALKNLNSDYIYIIATCHDFPGGTPYLAKKFLKKVKRNLNASFVVKMPGNYVPMYEPASKEKQQELFILAENKAKEISDAVKNRKTTKISRFGAIFSPFQKRNIKKILTNDKHFWITDKCTSCGVCEKICPIEDIELVEKKPRWLGKCQLCLACLQWCPTNAIEFGQKTAGRARYHHPNIKIAEMFRS